jgi:hypothetical protein
MNRQSLQHLFTVILGVVLTGHAFGQRLTGKQAIVTIFSTFSPSVRSNLAVLFVTGLCFWAGLAGLLPTLPLFIETLGGNGQQIVSLRDNDPSPQILVNRRLKMRGCRPGPPAGGRLGGSAAKRRRYAATGTGAMLGDRSQNCGILATTSRP